MLLTTKYRWQQTDLEDETMYCVLSGMQGSPPHFLDGYRTYHYSLLLVDIWRLPETSTQNTNMELASSAKCDLFQVSAKILKKVTRDLATL